MPAAVALALGVAIGGPATALAGQSAPVASAILDGPPAPVAPDVIARDASGRTTIRAIRLREPLKVDGALDESFYREVPAMSDFTQVEPQGGALATERTDTWLAFDEDNVYISFRCFDSDMARLVATEMRRDSTVLWQGNDLVAFVFDTFYDRRNSIIFTVSPLGARSDGQVV
jgi:hypothetical protein